MSKKKQPGGSIRPLETSEKVKFFDTPEALVNTVHNYVQSQDVVVIAVEELEKQMLPSAFCSVLSENDAADVADKILELKKHKDAVKKEYDLFAGKAHVIHTGITGKRAEQLGRFDETIAVLDGRIEEWQDSLSDENKDASKFAESDADSRKDNLPDGSIIPSFIPGIPGKIKSKNGSVGLKEAPVVQLLNSNDVLAHTLKLDKEIIDALMDIKYNGSKEQHKAAASKLLDMFQGDRFPISAITISETKLAKHCQDMDIEAGQIGGISLSYVSSRDYRSRKTAA